MKRYFYSLLARYISFYIPRGSRIKISEAQPSHLKEELDKLCPADSTQATSKETTTYIILNGILQYENDIQVYLEKLHEESNASTRILITYYSSLWKPLFRFAAFLRLRKAPQKNENWIAPSDLTNLLKLSGYELVTSTPRVLIPIPIPLLSNFLNRWLAPLPFFRLFALLNVAVARPLVSEKKPSPNPRSVSVVIAARNEAGNIRALFERLPVMGKSTEVIMIEGHSTDNTWQVIKDLEREYASRFKIITAQQEGHGKGDAIRKGFSLATGDILIILDADLSVPPEELPKFYRAISDNHAEFVNGSRLVYPMESEAMQFFNILGNKFFATAFTFVLGQSFKDTLCGTKVLMRETYLNISKNRDFFGDFDPFGDFDLIFGASRLGLKVIEIPIRYRRRVYGQTNISRWSHGLLLLKMLVFAAKRIRFI